MNVSNELYEKTKSEFINNIILNGTFAKGDDLRAVLNEFDKLMSNLKDKDEKEMVDIVISDAMSELIEVLNNNIIPGFVFGVKVNNINTKIYGGYKDNNYGMIEPDTMFDLASITKMFTQVLTYSLINDGVFSFDDHVTDLHPRFVNLKDITIRDITTFSTIFKTDKRINSCNNIEDARETLFNTKATKGEYQYTDIGMMVLKEIMEYQTNLSYEDLLNGYIKNKLGIKNTMATVPESLKDKITGSPNIDKRKINDSTANAVGGFSGHAGLWSNSDDLVTVGSAIINGELLAESIIKDFYYKSKFTDTRGIAGNFFVPSGEQSSFMPNIAPNKAFAVQGSTRTQLNVQKNDDYTAASTVLLNSAILDKKTINELEEKHSLKMRQDFVFEGEEIGLNDVRGLLPADKVSAPLIMTNTKTSLKLMFLDMLIKNYEKNPKMDINIEHNITEKVR